MAQDKSGFELIPEHIKEEIFSKLNSQSLARLSGASKTLNQEVKRYAPKLMKFHYPTKFIFFAAKPNINWLKKYEEVRASQFGFSDSEEEDSDTEIEPLSEKFIKILELIRADDLGAIQGYDLTLDDISAEKDRWDQSLIFWAAELERYHILNYFYNLALIEFAIKDGDPPQKRRDSFGRSLLFWAVMCDQNSLKINALIKNGYDYNLQDVDGNTPVHIATEYNHSGPLKCLLKAEADPNISNQSGQTAIFLAKKPKIINLLAKFKADINALNDEGFTPLMCAANDNKLQVLTCLLENNAIIDFVNPGGTPNNEFTALHRAVSHLHVDSVRVLLESGADVNATDVLGRTALHMLLYSGGDYLRKANALGIIDGDPRQEICRLLLRWDPNLDARGRFIFEEDADLQLTALELAIKLECTELQALIEAHARSESTTTFHHPT